MVPDVKLVLFFKRLRPRHQHTVYLASLGFNNADIGERLCITKGVVAGYLSDIYLAMGELEELVHYGQINRYTLIAVFAGFFDRHPDLEPLIDDEARR